MSAPSPVPQPNRARVALRCEYFTAPSVQLKPRQLRALIEELLPQQDKEAAAQLSGYLKHGDKTNLRSLIADGLLKHLHPHAVQSMIETIQGADVQAKFLLISALSLEACRARRTQKRAFFASPDLKTLRETIASLAVDDTIGMRLTAPVERGADRKIGITATRAVTALMGHAGREVEAPALCALFKGGNLGEFSNHQALEVLGSVVNTTHNQVLSKEAFGQVAGIFRDPLRHKHIYLHAATLLRSCLDLSHATAPDIYASYLPVLRQLGEVVEAPDYWGLDGTQCARVGSAIWLLRDLSSDAAMRSLLQSQVNFSHPFVAWMSHSTLNLYEESTPHRIEEGLRAKSVGEDWRAALQMLEWSYSPAWDVQLIHLTERELLNYTGESTQSDNSPQASLVDLISALQNALWFECPRSARSCYFWQSFSQDDQERLNYALCMIQDSDGRPVLDLPIWAYENRDIFEALSRGLRRLQKTEVLASFLEDGKHLYGFKFGVLPAH